jgi:hypothetical protein
MPDQPLRRKTDEERIRFNFSYAYSLPNKLISSIIISELKYITNTESYEDRICCKLIWRLKALAG